MTNGLQFSILPDVSPVNTLQSIEHVVPVKVPTFCWWLSVLLSACSHVTEQASAQIALDNALGPDRNGSRHKVLPSLHSPIFIWGPSKSQYMNQLFTLYPLYKVQYSHGALRGNHTSLRAEHQHSRTNTKHCTCQLKTSKPPIDNTTQEPVACSQIVAMNSSEWPPKPFSAAFYPVFWLRAPEKYQKSSSVVDPRNHNLG